MNALIINFVLYFLTAIRVYKKEKGLSVNALCFLYLSFFAFTGILIYDTPYYMWGRYNEWGSVVRNDMSIIPLVFIYIGFIIYYFSVKEINTNKIEGYFILKRWAENLIYYLNIVVLIIIIISYFGLSDNISNYSEAYEEAKEGTLMVKSRLGRLGDMSMIICSGLNISQVILPFYMFMKHNHEGYFKGGLLLVLFFAANFSISSIQGSRGRLFFAVFDLIFVYQIFKKMMDTKVRIIFVVIVSISMVVFVTLAIYISIDRFGTDYTLKIASYFGESFLNFPLIYWNPPKFYGGLYTLSRMNLAELGYHKVQTYYFKPLPGALYIDFGIIGTYIFLLIYSTFFRRLLGKTKKIMRMDKALLYCFLICGFVYGAFSFYVCGWSGYVILAMTYLLFKFGQSDRILLQNSRNEV